MEKILQRKLVDLVAENHIRASVLYYFGVRYYDYKGETLAEVCKKHGLREETLINALDLIADGSPTTLAQIKRFPVDLVIEYLKHAHYLFVKKRLPYIGQLIEGLTEVNERYEVLSRDLKSIFPLFVEDFVAHMYEEEDTLFSYVRDMSAFIKGEKSGSDLIFSMEKFSIKEFALDNEMHENEMDGFRQFTNGYSYSADADLQIKVLFSELQRFESDLKIHAKVEDEVLLPKALQLERQVKLRFHDLSKLN
ncbi:regulator of cell morphogenesis and NO signaling [Roseivirga pacifica]|uniref:Regulator of cell morphogenesis and NO signaling n=1 Tax=Roseivirga pacifica TaxID=1267423 RepID=A0A1I0NWR9_9BACT|nr:hemerythrin domain-containing protein [Roseivirga pacifica]RKQ51523.1 regulator of cell morphogenesis and NO signaling [Roseivirga pacifica]SEW06206.1 regulator of cell morphogenesis and NO signaling [Roseivirga pacifica]